MDLYSKDNRFNLANLLTFANITCGVMAMYLVQKDNFFVATIMAWIAGALDIADGKVARKFNLSTEFGVQIDSFADFLSFVVMPAFLLFYASKHYAGISGAEELILGIVFIWYIISGLIRLVEFNLAVDAGKVERFFTGVPTPLGAILLWLIYIAVAYGVLSNGYFIGVLVFMVAWSLNSRLKIPHP